MISRDARGNGFWAVEFVRSGYYRIALRDRPPYVDHPLAGCGARLVVGDREWVQDIPPNAGAVEFTIHATSGLARLQSFLLDGDAELRGVYFVKVSFLGETSSPSDGP